MSEKIKIEFDYAYKPGTLEDVILDLFTVADDLMDSGKLGAAAIVGEAARRLMAAREAITPVATCPPRSSDGSMGGA